MNALSPHRALFAVVAGDFSDPTNERLIYLSAAGLAVLGLALLTFTILWWRRGRQEHPALAPLEVMSTRGWATATDADRRRRLDRVRLDGSPATGVELVRADPVDLQALVRSVPQAFDDLRDPAFDDLRDPDEAEHVPDEPHVFAVSASGDVAIVTPADDIREPEVDSAPEQEPVAIDSDATTFAAVERPTPLPPEPQLKESVDALASGPNDPSS